MKKVMFYSFNFNLELIFQWSRSEIWLWSNESGCTRFDKILYKQLSLQLILYNTYLERMHMEDKFQIEVERREHYLFHRLQIQLRNVLTFSVVDQFDINIKNVNSSCLHSML